MNNKVMFQGNSYDVPTWGNWIAKDVNGDIYGYAEMPKLCSDGIYAITRGDSQYLGNENCVEIV